MFDAKILFGVLSIIVSFLTVAPYLRDMLRGKTKPHIFSWILWTFTGLIVSSAQIWDNAGPGAWATFTSTALCFLILILSFKYGEKHITRADVVMFSIGLLAIPAWFFTGHPLLSVIIVSGIDMIAYGPTARKSWAKPHEETALLYILAGTWETLSLLAMENYTLTNILSPASLLLCNLIFVPYLFIRRHQLQS